MISLTSHSWARDCKLQSYLSSGYKTRDPWTPSSSREQAKDPAGLFISASYKLDTKRSIEYIRYKF